MTLWNNSSTIKFE